MRALLECIPCVLNQSVEVLRRLVKDQHRRTEILTAVLKRLSELPITDMTPPDMTFEIHKILKQMIGHDDLYDEIKHQNNQQALKLYPKMEKTVHSSKEPLLTAIKLAIAGNIIDYGPNHKFDVEQTIEKVLKQELKSNHLDEFKRKLSAARKVLYIGDNAGEIVFDKLLIDQISKGTEVVFAVKSAPALNDITINDAKEVGMQEIAKVIESGSVIAGTIYEKTTAEFKKSFKEADLVIAKGQGNFETLKPTPKVFYLLMVKCEHLARASGMLKGDIILWSK